MIEILPKFSLKDPTKIVQHCFGWWLGTEQVKKTLHEPMMTRFAYAYMCQQTIMNKKGDKMPIYVTVKIYLKPIQSRLVLLALYLW